MSSLDDRRRQEEADAAYARRLQTEEQKSEQTMSSRTSELQAKLDQMEEDAKCDLPGHISQTKNKHAGAGLSRGLQSAAGGVAAGVAALVAAPVIGAKEGGGKGFAAGLGAGILGAIALPIVGICSGVYEVGVGIANTPAAIQASAEGKEWDPSSNTWILYDLKKEEALYLSTDGDDKLRAHIAKRRERQGQEEQTKHAVKDSKLYDVLGCEPGDSDAKIKQAYYKKALTCHPDKFPGDDAKKQAFQDISGAYAVLSDPAAKQRYDATGEADDAPAADPSVFFAMIFGSEEFSEYVGELKVAQMSSGADGDSPDDAELAFRQRRRCVELAHKLVKRIAARVDDALDKDAFFATCKADGADLAKTPFGATLTKLIARSYIGAANAYLASGPQAFGQSLADGAHSTHNYFKAGRDGLGVVSAARAAENAERAATETETTEVVCVDNNQPASKASCLIVHNDQGWHALHFFAAAAARDRFSKLSYAHTSVLFDKNGDEWRLARKFGPAASVQQVQTYVAQSPGLTSKTLRELISAAKKTSAMESVFEAVWRVSVLDMESTLRDATSKLFRDTSVLKEVREKRARAVKNLGKAFLQAVDEAGHTETWKDAIAAQVAQQSGGPTPAPAPESSSSF